MSASGAAMNAASPSSLARRNDGRSVVTTVPIRSARMSWAWSSSTPARYDVYPEMSAIRRQVRSGGFTVRRSYEPPGLPHQRSAPVLERVHDPRVCRDDVVIGNGADLRPVRLVVEDGRRRFAARESNALDDGLDRRARVPDLIDDEHALVVQQRIARKLQEHGLVAGLSLVVVERDCGDEDVAHAEQVGQHPRWDEPATRDREHHLVLASDLLRQAFDEDL